MRWLVQGGVTSWLLFLSFWVWLIPFNEYGDLSIVDCDQDAEAVVAAFIVLIWLSTLLVVSINLILKYWRKAKPLWFITGLSIFLSIASIPKRVDLIQYSADIAQRCP